MKSIESLVGKKLKSYSMIGVLGAGSIATVYEAIDDKTNSRVAVKAIPIKLIKEKPKLKQLIQTQIRVLKQCKNDNVIKHIDSFKSDKNIFIVTQFCNSGDVQQHLQNKGRLSEQQATDILKQILNGFKGLHEVNAMHRDFKLANLLIHNGVIKIADLGFAKQMEKQNSIAVTQLGTSVTMAPQVLDGMAYGMNADVWSLGVVYYQMLFGKYPYIGHSDAQIRRNIKKQKPLFPKDIKISENAKDFILKCLTQNPKERITWSEIYQHPLISCKVNLIYSTHTSKINFDSNLDYYKNHKPEADKKLMYPQKQKEQHFITEGNNEINQYTSQQQGSVSSYEKLIKQNEAKKILQKQIYEYEQQLLKKRNNIMFMFPFFFVKIYPYIEQIVANHNLPLFLICKNTVAYLEKFIRQIQDNIGKKDVKSVNFKNFLESENCPKFLKLLKQDQEGIQQQAMFYVYGIGSVSKQINEQTTDLRSWKHQAWQVIVHQALEQYWHQIAQSLNSQQSFHKVSQNLALSNSKKILQILRALQYYNSNTETSCQTFEKILETLDYEEYKEQVNRKLFEAFK